MNITVRVLTKQAAAALAAVETGLKRTNRTANSMSMGAGAFNAANRSVRAFGSSLQWAAYQLTHAFTYPLLLAGGAAIKYELDNERAFAQLKKVYGDTALQIKIGTAGINRELAALRDQFIALSNVYGQSQTDVINIAQAWAAAGVSGRALGQSVEATMKTMVIGDINAADATKALISLQAQYGANTGELIKILQALNVTENITGASMQDLITAFSQSASIAAATGIDYKHLAALIAALVPAAGSANKAGNALKTLFTRILVPTAKATQVMTQLGIAVDSQSWLSLSAAKRMEVLAQKWKDLDGNQRALVADTVAGKYRLAQFSQAMVDIGKSFDKSGKQISDSSDKLGYYGKTLAGTRDDVNNARIAQQELQTVLESNPQKLKQMWTIIKNEAGSTFAKLIPVLLVIMNVVTQMVQGFANLSPTIQKFIGILAVGLAVFGPVLFYLAAIGRLMDFLFRGGARAKRGVMAMIGAFKGETAAAAAGMSNVVAANEAATSAVVANTQAALASVETTAIASATATAEAAAAAAQSGAKAVEVAEYEKALAAERSAALQLRTATASVSAQNKFYEVGARRKAELYALSAADIIQDELGIAKVAAAVNSSVAATSAAAAEEMTTVYVAGAAGIEAAFVSVGVVMAQVARMQGLLAAAAALEAEAAVAAEAAKITAMLEEVSVMRATMGSRLLLTRTWTAAGLLEARSVDQVTARLMIQMEVLRAMQAQAILTSKRMLEAGAAASASTAVATIPKASKTVATTGAAAGGTVLLGSRVVGAAEQATKKTEGIFKRSFGKISVWAAAAFGGVGKSAAKGLGSAGSAVSKFLAGFLRLLTKLPLVGFIFSAISKAGMALAGALGVSGGFIAAIIAGVIAIFLLFRDRIIAAFEDVTKKLINLAKNIWNAMKAVGSFIAGGVRMIINAIAALPRAFATVFQGVVDIVARAAKNVYELFSYLNPFAHHSPSLVENVTRGMDIIAKKFAGITAISVPIKRAYNDVKIFGQAIAGLIARQAALKRSEDITSLRDAGAAGAIDSYLRMDSTLQELTADYKRLGDAITAQQVIVDAYQKRVDELNDALDVQKDKLSKLQATQQKYAGLLDDAKNSLDKFANTGITGMRAMSDAIFDNEMAQKKLQLQMMQMEDAIGPIDKVQEKLAALAGDIETLRGEQTDLRKAGAGSDILKTYDDQIKAIEDQAAATKVQTKQYDDMAAALEALQRQGDKLDLEQSLQFDPLTRQIQQLADGLNELPFDQIIDGIKKSQTEIDKYTGAYDKATDAINAQQAIVDKAQAAHDAMQKTLDNEQKKLDAIRDVYAKVGDSISAINDALSNMSSAAQDVTKALKDAADAGSGVDLAGLDAGLQGAGGTDVLGRMGGLQEQTAQIEKDTQDALNKLKASFDKIDIFGGLKDKFKKFGAWIKKWFWEEPAKWGNWFLNNTGPLGEAVGIFIDTLIKGVFAAPEIFDFVKKWGGKLFGAIWDGLQAAWSVVSGFFSDLWGWIVSGLESGMKALGDFFVKLPGRILGFLGDAGKWLVNVGKNVLYGLGYGLGYSIGAVAKFFIDLPSNILKWTRNAGKWLLTTGVDILVGLIVGLANAMVKLSQWFTSLPGKIISWLGNARQWLISSGVDLLTGLWNGIQQGALAVINWFTNLPTMVVGFFSGAGTWLWDTGGNILSGLLNGLLAGVKAIWSWITSFISGFIDGFLSALGIKSPSTVFYSIAVDIIKGLLNGLIAAGKWIWDWFTALPKQILIIIGNAAIWLVQKGIDIGQGILDGLGRIIGGILDWFKALPGKIIHALGDLAGIFLRVGKTIAENMWTGIKGIISFVGDLGKNIYNAVAMSINDGLIRPIKNWKFTIGAFGIHHTFQPFGSMPELPILNADGGIYDKATNAIIGEAGREVVIPLTRPQRAMELAQKSGLLDMLLKQDGLYSKSLSNGVSGALSKLARVEATTTNTVNNTVHNDNRTYNFNGDLSFPNIKSGNDAEDFLRNLETLAGR